LFAIGIGYSITILAITAIAVKKKLRYAPQPAFYHRPRHREANPPPATALLSATTLLHQLEDAALGRRMSAPGGDWRGFAFRLGRRDGGYGRRAGRHDGEYLVVPLADGMEIASATRLCALPHCHNWVRGITALRGAIYTVIDFADFLGFGATDAVRARLLLLPAPQHDVHSALLLDRRVSLRAFEHGLPEVGLDGVAASLAPYLRASVREGARQWGVLDVGALLFSEKWLRVGR